jgi:hypothetical protein
MKLIVVLSGLVVIVLANGPKVVGSNTTDGDGFLRVIKICSTAFFGGE